MKKFLAIYLVILVFAMTGAVYLGNSVRDRVMASSAIDFVNTFRGSEDVNLDDKAKDYLLDRVISGDGDEDQTEEVEKDYKIRTGELDANEKDEETIKDVIEDVIKEKAKEEVSNQIDNYGD